MTQFEALFDGRSFAAILFDMDGTLLSSIEAAERVWTRWAAQFGIDARTFLHGIHGQRAVDSVRQLNIPGVDPVAEAHAITLAEIEDVEGVHPIPGAREFVSTLPEGRWAIVTSAPRALAVRRLAAAGLKPPSVFITAEDIPRGKPDPACYQLAARQLGWTADDCVVFEDAAAGIRAGEAAGAPVVVITATHQRPMDTRHPTYVDYNALGATIRPDGRLQIRSQSTRKI
ncbi:glycerol-3-phosphatase [Steroidobacter agaridevorans]|uniref:Glycerol-3-phosphatase n=1 Tax=Steroidobacter agaridevorans TaxID=2695856 RepID=A0A829YG83_9GAMM|nr:HAD-IA family hydrolase [Steroidobacter agaridevorans]GFE82230.1 glycerol-3-phosphatase [Steroidobacter agaridevorans]GFE85382.1 glycerol-3-phosphatase [Steroidobacter agaridevorans]